jgi:hypothetical protein
MLRHKGRIRTCLLPHLDCFLYPEVVHILVKLCVYFGTYTTVIVPVRVSILFPQTDNRLTFAVLGSAD